MIIIVDIGQNNRLPIPRFALIVAVADKKLAALAPAVTIAPIVTVAAKSLSNLLQRVRHDKIASTPFVHKGS